MVALSNAIRYHALRTPDRTAIIYDGRHISYRTLMARALSMAGWLDAQGIGAGDVVAVLMKNSAAFLEICLAVGHIGAVFLPINFRLSRDEVRFICEDAGTKLLFADAEFEQTASQGLDPVFLDDNAQADSGKIARGADAATAVPRGPQDLFRLMYTSGTTDRPKGVIHTYGNFHWKSYDHIAALGLTQETRLLVAGPLYHVGAFDLPGVAVLLVGGLLFIHRDFRPEAILASIDQERLNAGWLAPVMTGNVLEAAARGDYDLTSLRWIIGGGERTPESRVHAFGECFRNARYIDSYGLTESCSGDTLMDAGREIEKIGSTGRAVPNVAITIRDDDGQALSPGDQGEICLSGPKVTGGYWNAPDKTRASFFGDWFRTGDTGYLDAEGFLYITDRKKDMIISGGENIASSEIERVLYEHPAVAEAAVIGMPDEKWGERPVAVVVVAQGRALSYEQLVDHCRDRLAGFKVPKSLVLRDALPRNPSGKILKRVLRDELAQ